MTTWSRFLLKNFIWISPTLKHKKTLTWLSKSDFQQQIIENCGGIIPALENNKMCLEILKTCMIWVDFWELGVDLIFRHNFNVKIHLNFSDLFYRKVASSNTSRLEAHAGFFRLLMKGIFDLCTVTFWQEVDFLISNVR